MIIPGFFKDLFKRPEINLAWIFVLLNFLVYGFTLISFSKWPSDSLSLKIKDKNFAVSVSQMYQQTLDPIERINLNESTIVMQALRDQRFWKRIASFPFAGDQVQIEKNRAMLIQFQTEYTASAQFQLGLGAIETSPWAWLTYQFTHASIVHLLSNIIFVFLIISYLELQVGLFWLVCVYLIGGFAGGFSFLYFDGAGSMAMVGASASASALMGFLMVIKKNQLMPWSYLIAPVPQGYGVIYLPAFFIFPLFLMTDFISALWEPAGVQSAVAVSAHIGGALAGFLFGIIYLTEEKLKNLLVQLGWSAQKDLTEDT